MNMLALETSSNACSVALQFNGKITSLHRAAPMQQTNLLLPMIDEILTNADTSLAKLEAIAFGTGPGSFTGMRIASSVTQGLAFAANLPVIRISSLAALAQAAHMQSPHNAYLVAVDARMGQIYWGHYVATETEYVTLQGEEVLCFPTDIPPLTTQPAECTGVGDGWDTYGTSIKQTLGIELTSINAAQIPTALAVLTLALKNIEKNKLLSATEALPSYLIKR